MPTITRTYHERDFTSDRLSRFFNKVEFSDSGCWLWTGFRNQQNGYGRVAVARIENKSANAPAHRWLYTIAVCPVQPFLELDHLCRTRHCVNPSHLEVVSHRDNSLRGDNPMARQARQTHCKRSHEFTPENTQMDGTSRRCRTCTRMMLNARRRIAREVNLSAS